MEWNLCHGAVKLPMNQGIDFYNLSQELAGAIFGALIQKIEPPSDPLPPLLQLRRGRADTAEAIDQQLHYRGYSAGEFAAALQDLVERGWLEETADNLGHFALTAEGIRIREAAENQTDAYFYTPWKALQPSEVQELHQLILKLKDGLQLKR